MDLEVQARRWTTLVNLVGVDEQYYATAGEWPIENPQFGEDLDVVGHPACGAVYGLVWQQDDLPGDEEPYTPSTAPKYLVITKQDFTNVRFLDSADTVEQLKEVLEYRVTEGDGWEIRRVVDLDTGADVSYTVTVDVEA